MTPVPSSTDYYGLCEMGVMNLLRTLTQFSADPMTQVTDDRNKINKGFDYWAVFVPNTFTSRKLDVHSKVYNWSVQFDLYVRYKTSAEALARFRAVRSQIINAIDVYPTLNGTRGVEMVTLAAKSEVLQDTPGDNPNFIIQTFLASVAQRVVSKF